MRGIALVVPLIVLALMHVLQRMEVWATDTSQRTARRRPAVEPHQATDVARSIRQTEVSRRRVEGEASHHG